MYSKLIKTTVFCGLVISLSACSSFPNTTGSAETFEAKEKLYQSVKNHNALISLYRDVLKKNDDPNIRYKLAESYYQAGDSNSSLLYLQPLLARQDQLGEAAAILQIRNQIQLAKYDEAMNNATALIARSPSNGEAYNLRGIIFAQNGKLQDAFSDINKARELFISDLVAINNLAMLSIINGDYRNASELLLPQYLNGSKDRRLIHNLVFALVKSGDTDYALDIIRKEKLNTSPEDLINALKKTERMPSIHY
ncbi:tetratricopeptide repeat protein [Glaesserella sp.]|uniref:tetratricopeptide repeat protein n=1 Tax=Glaesserella sp. TaxID=2094731 RepID=UPI0035A05934